MVATGGRFSGLEDEYEWPLAVGEVEGIRAWRLCTFGCLHPLHVDALGPWLPGENTAKCLKVDHYRMPPGLTRFLHAEAAPDNECTCGFYAYFPRATDLLTRSKLTDMAAQGGDPPRPCVFGLIKGYGRTLIGTEGFRCEKARITTIYADPDSERAKALMRAYPGVSVENHPIFGRPLLSEVWHG